MKRDRLLKVLTIGLMVMGTVLLVGCLSMGQSINWSIEQLDSQPDMDALIIARDALTSINTDVTRGKTEIGVWYKFSAEGQPEYFVQRTGVNTMEAYRQQ